jgi:ribokinase
VSRLVAVVGHVEFVEFLMVERLPRAGEILHATEAFTRAAGGGGVAAAVLAELGGKVELFCALGDDQIGRAARAQLEERGVRVHAALRAQPTRRATTLLERAGERAIVTIGDRLAPVGADPLPWERLTRADAVYFTAGDAEALRKARQARVLVATPRAGAELASGPRLDALVWSARDQHERALAERVRDRARLLVATEGAEGGHWSIAADAPPTPDAAPAAQAPPTPDAAPAADAPPAAAAPPAVATPPAAAAKHLLPAAARGSGGRWRAVPPPGPVRDAYGAGDAFAAALTYALATGAPVADAVARAAEWGARILARPGAP